MSDDFYDKSDKQALLENQNIMSLISQKMELSSQSFHAQNLKIQQAIDRYSTLSSLSRVSDMLIKGLRSTHTRNVMLVYGAYYLLIGVAVWVFFRRIVWRKFLRFIWYIFVNMILGTGSSKQIQAATIQAANDLANSPEL